MFIRLFDDDERDLYIQLADEMIRLMAEGQLATGDELPSIRKLAASLQINMKTVQAAYQKLADEGFIVQRKKATAIVGQDHFNETHWLERWQKTFTRFHNECKAQNLTDKEIQQLIEVVFERKRST